jgi:O-antigen/teichoic acid export membrane protein
MKNCGLAGLRSRFEQLGRRSGTTTAVLFSVSSQAWMALAGPATILVIAHTLEPARQGFYYTFSSLLGIQVFFELGLATVIVQVASHEWASLRRGLDGRLEGNAGALSRLASLGRFSSAWYAIAAILLVTILLIGGDYFFASRAVSYSIEWKLPWMCLSVAMGLNLLIQPQFSLIEGCNQVSSVYGIRLVQAIAASLGIMVALVFRGGLYSLAVGAGLRLIIGTWWLAFRQRDFLFLVLRSRPTEKVDWWHDVWPFQWRIAVSWLSGYIIFSLITPAMFQFHGPIVAGQMGMSLALVGAVESFACAWLNTRSPRFGILVAQRNYPALDELFARSLRASLLIAALGALGVVAMLTMFDAILPQYVTRFLPLLPMGLLVIYRVTNVGITGMALYLRAHKQEPLMGVSLVNAILSGLAIWLLGKTFGPTGAIAGSLAATLFWSLPSCYLIFRRCRIEWHRAI